MKGRKITFACELAAEPLRELFEDPALIEQLQAMSASVALGILDFSSERAAVVRRLNDAGIPVIAWLLLPKEEGYWFNLYNSSQATRRYGQFKAWTAQYHLKWCRVGLDFEPDIREIQGMIQAPKRAMMRLLPRIFEQRRFQQGLMDFRSLMTQIHLDGYLVESYQFPFIIDERRAGATLLQRLFGMVDLEVDREVLMLYTSFMRGYGPGLLWSYARDAQAIGIGSTGGGVELDGVSTVRPLDWDELERDLLLADQFTDDLFVFSLEGCVQQGFLQKIRELNWEKPVPLPVYVGQRVSRLRRIFQALLWLSVRPFWVLLAILGLFWLFGGKRKR